MVIQRICIGIIGGNETTEEIAQQAYEAGKQIALKQAVLVCGGLGGVMEAASRGAAENGGLVIGILPGEEKVTANPYVHIAIPTGMGHARNALVVRCADVLIAFPGSYGTLNEIAFALSSNKAVVYLPGTWNLRKIGTINSALFKEAFDASNAVGLALGAINIKP
jgi:uncharacterized protein (TIGR00725 family)